MKILTCYTHVTHRKDKNCPFTKDENKPILQSSGTWLPGPWITVPEDWVKYYRRLNNSWHLNSTSYIMEFYVESGETKGRLISAIDRPTWLVETEEFVAKILKTNFFNQITPPPVVGQPLATYEFYNIQQIRSLIPSSLACYSALPDILKQVKSKLRSRMQYVSKNSSGRSTSIEYLLAGCILIAAKEHQFRPALQFQIISAVDNVLKGYRI